MSDFSDDDLDEDGYFAEVDEGDPTGLEPRFVKMDELQLTPVQLTEATVNDLFAKYIALRNQLTTDRRGYKAREAKMKNQMLTISNILLTKSTALGVDSLSGSAGSGYKQKKERIKVAPEGWDDFVRWLDQTKNFHTVQKRVSSDAVKEIREATGQLPPGLESFEELTFVVRSPSARKSRT